MKTCTRCRLFIPTQQKFRPIDSIYRASISDCIDQKQRCNASHLELPEVSNCYINCSNKLLTLDRKFG